MAAERAFVSCERIVPTAELTADAPVRRRCGSTGSMVDGVVEAPNGAHFTSCAPDYDRDEAFQREYAAAAADPRRWAAFRDRYLDGDEADYQAAVTRVGDEAA